MSEPTIDLGRPDDSWDEKSKAEYEALKASWLADLPEEPFWLDQPTVPFDQVIDTLDRLEQESAARGSRS
ncbi:MAG TPA: hypothetical protein VHR66_22445 [Gemmataceae bacterium]|jgi:hypothetical protein|nr:hypothetical protein [Gemmataceae bacterium]